MDQAKENVRCLGCLSWLLVERAWHAFGCEDREFASLWIWIFFFSSVVFMGEMKSLYIKVRFLFFKYDSISVYAKSSLT